VKRRLVQWPLTTCRLVAPVLFLLPPLQRVKTRLSICPSQDLPCELPHIVSNTWLSKSIPAPRRRRRHNKQVPTPLVPEPPLPASTLPSRILLRRDENVTWYGCRHTCGSKEDCKRTQGWKAGSILGHEQSHTKHPQCLVSACPAHPILKRRDRPNRRGELRRVYNQERRGQSRAEPSSLPLPSLSSNSLTPSTSATSTSTAPIYPSPLPSQKRHKILYVTDPVFEYSSYRNVDGEVAYHYAFLNDELFNNSEMNCAFRKLLFKGREVEKDIEFDPGESRTVCYLYNYVSHM